MWYRAGVLSGLVLCGLVACSEEATEPLAANGAAAPGLQVEAEPAATKQVADWWFPGMVDTEGEFAAVLSVDRFSQADLEATLDRWVGQVEFEEEKAEFERGFIEGLWSSLFEEIGFRQFILQDHGVEYVAFGASAKNTEFTEADDIQFLLRTTQPEQHTLAYEGVGLLDTTNDIGSMQRLDEYWLELKPAEQTETDETSAASSDSLASLPPYDHGFGAISTQLPEGRSLYVVMIIPNEMRIIPEVDPRELPEEFRSVIETYGEIEMPGGLGVAVGFGESPSLLATFAFSDTDAAEEYSDAAARLIEVTTTSMDSLPELSPVDAAVMQIYLQVVGHPKRDGRFISYEFTPEQLDKIAKELGGDLLPAMPLMILGSIPGT